MNKKIVKQPLWARTPWSWLFSLRVGIVLLAIVTIASIYGTVIPDLKEAQRLVYYSWWYELLLILLAVNMSFTTWKTLASKVLPSMKARFLRQLPMYTGLRPNTVRTVKGDVNDVAKAFRRHGFKVSTEDQFGYARRGMFSRWGAVISHIGFVMVLIGGFASGFLNMEGFIMLLEGERTNVMYIQSVKQGEAPTPHELGFTLMVEDFDTGFFPQTRIPSHFRSIISELDEDGNRVQTDRVEVNHSMSAGGWLLHQTSYNERPELPRYKLLVDHENLNEPVEMEISPNQKRPVPNLPGWEMGIRHGSGLQWVALQNGKSVDTGQLSGKSLSNAAQITVKAIQFEPDFVIGPDSTYSSRSQDMNNPALLLELTDEKGVEIGRQWLFARDDMKGMMHSRVDPYRFEITEITNEHNHLHFHISASIKDEETPFAQINIALNEEQTIGNPKNDGEAEEDTTKEESESPWNVSLIERVPSYQTTITLTRNPVIPFIYFGCAVMILGLMVGFFIRRREVWFKLDLDGSTLRVAAQYRHPADELDTATLAALDELTIKKEKAPKGREGKKDSSKKGKR